MTKDLYLEDISSDLKPKIYTMDYNAKDQIDGVKIIELKTFLSEEGDFGEIMRLGSKGEFKDIPDFVVSQINRTMLLPASVKAWHLHLRQDEVWFVIPSGHLLVGLWDMRKKSSTKGNTMRIVLGGGHSQLLYIPRGVSHGSLNLDNKPTELFYFMNKQFDINNPDEKRVPWDAKGADFWKAQRD